jgi:hypothetical protein
MNKEENMQDIPAEIRPFLTRRRVLQAGAIGGAAAVAAACGAGGSTTDSSAPAAEGVDISETDKKVVFKRFVKNEKLQHLETELTNSHMTYAANKPLDYRYAMSEQSEFPKIVLAEIRKNLID